MKKYIRTEEGIFEIFDTHNGYSNHFGYKYSKNCTILLDEESIRNSRQADTIEELCDGYYWDYGQSFDLQDVRSRSEFKHLQEWWLEYLEMCEEDNEEPDAAYYGFIKTDKGLIYVARMNNEGELELI